MAGGIPEPKHPTHTSQSDGIPLKPPEKIDQNSVQQSIEAAEMQEEEVSELKHRKVESEN